MKRGGLVVASAIVFGGCSASGTTTGGDPRFDTAEPIATPAGAEDAGSGTRFTDLYRDFFGPTGQASCAGSGQCHGSATEPGAASSSFICADQAGCYATMSSSSLVRASDATDPSNSVLISVLRHRDTAGKVVGFMPKSPAYEFSSTSIARISTWIAAGAPND